MSSAQRARRAPRRPVPESPHAPERARQHHRLLGAGVWRILYAVLTATSSRLEPQAVKAMAIGSPRDAEASWPDHGEELILTPKMSPSRRAFPAEFLLTWSRSPAGVQAPFATDIGGRRVRSAAAGSRGPISRRRSSGFARGGSSRLRGARNGSRCWSRKNEAG
jgi:hypothetical protein